MPKVTTRVTSRSRLFRRPTPKAERRPTLSSTYEKEANHEIVIATPSGRQRLCVWTGVERKTGQLHFGWQASRGMTTSPGNRFLAAHSCLGSVAISQQP